MSMEIGTATSATDLLDRLNTFMLKGHSLTPTYTGTGNGTISGVIGTAASVQETITVTLTGATTFDVSGSVTGSMGSGTVGTPFAHAKVAFTVNAGGTDWVSGDTISFVMTPPWVAMRSTAGSEYIWKAPGNANTDAIYVGARYFTDPVGYYNWQLGGFTGYSAGVDFGLQPGSITNSASLRGVVLPLWNQSIPYWFFANGRRVVVIAKVSSQFEAAYLGFLESYPSPAQWPYPLVVGGSMAFSSEPEAGSTSWAYSYSGDQHTAFPKAKPYNMTNFSQLRVRLPDGSWKGFSSAGYSAPGAIWPYTGTMSDFRPNLDGSYPLLPIVLSDATPNTYGRFDGVFATTGYGNGAENVLTVGRDSWLVVQNVYRNTKTDFYAVRMD
mgnify:CR=1 FL=1